MQQMHLVAEMQIRKGKMTNLIGDILLFGLGIAFIALLVMVVYFMFKTLEKDF